MLRETLNTVTTKHIMGRTAKLMALTASSKMLTKHTHRTNYNDK